MKAAKNAIASLTADPLAVLHHVHFTVAVYLPFKHQFPGLLHSQTYCTSRTIFVVSIHQKIKLFFYNDDAIFIPLKLSFSMKINTN